MEPHWDKVGVGAPWQSPICIDAYIHPLVHLSMCLPTDVPCARLLVRCWEGTCGYNSSVFRELRDSDGGTSQESTAALTVTQADDWTYSKRASASPSFPLLLGPETSVKQVGGIQKSAYGEKNRHEAMSRA